MGTGPHDRRLPRVDAPRHNSGTLVLSQRFAVILRTLSRATAVLAAGVLAASSLAIATPALASEVQVATLTGTVTRIADAESVSDTWRLFAVEGEGYLRLDFSKVGLGLLELEKLTVDVEVPASVDLSGTEEEDFAALRDYTLANGALTVTDVPSSEKTSRVVSGQTNLTPATPAVHRVFAVLVTPNTTGGGPAANQTVSKVQGAVTQANSYWSEQSGGTIGFELAGVVPWYSDASLCSTEGGSDELWAEAAARAKPLGYKPSPNTHLSLFFPSATTCGSWLGLGSLGNSVNSGGVTWVIGSDQPRDYAAFAHELGHNMSLGHANWQSCGVTDPHPGFYLTGCSEVEYGDVTDVMGFGITGKSGGALSSPNAIRASIWNSSSYDVAPKGTTTYTLNAVSSNSGKRAVVVEDYDGTSYFVEYRNQTGEDAQYAANGCTASHSCAAASPGIRILRHHPSEDLYAYTGRYYKGIFWEGSDAITRGASKPNWVAGESFNSSAGSTGFTVTVNSVNGATATVTVTRRANTTSTGGLDIFLTKSHDNYIRVGDTASVFMANSWKGDKYSYQWYRYPSTKISGATKSSYTFTNSDKGKCVIVKVTATGAGQSSRTATTPNRYANGYDCFGLVKAGVLVSGTATVDAETFHPAFAAVPGGWTEGASFKYQWYRSTTATSTLSAIKGATKQKYTPTSSDSGKFLSVKITGSKSGFGSASTQSARKNYTVTSAGSVAVTGVAKVGVTLGLTNNAVFTRQASGTTIVSPSLRYQWLANGATISGATSTTFTPTATHYGKTISVRVTGSTPGYASASVTSPATAKTTKGTIAGGSSVAITSKSSSSSGIVLTASAPGVTEPGVKLAYQWTRNGVAIKKATKSTYKLTSADHAKDVVAKITITKSNYTTVVLTTTLGSYSVVPTTPLPVITGNPAVGQTLGVAARNYSNGGVATYQWLRDGKAITGATSATYLTTTTDKGKAISVKVVAANPGYLSSTTTSAKTEKLGTFYQAGWTNAPTFSMTNTATLTLTAVPGVTEPGVTATYQWYRGATAISKATKSTYKLTSADRGKETKVRVVTKKTGYTTVTTTAAPQNFSIMATSPFKPSVDDTTPVVGQTLTAIAPGYTQSVTHSYQWYVSGKALSGATSIQLVVPASAKGKTISVRIVATKTGYLSNTTTSAATSKVTAT